MAGGTKRRGPSVRISRQKNKPASKKGPPGTYRAALLFADGVRPPFRVAGHGDKRPRHAAGHRQRTIMPRRPITQNDAAKITT